MRPLAPSHVKTVPRLDLTGVPAMCFALVVGLVVETLPGFLSRRYSAYEIVWLRYSTHLALMLLLWAPRDPGRLLRTRRPVLHAVRSLTMLGMPTFFVLAITRYPRDAVMAVYWLEPLLAMLMAAVVLRERVGRRWWLAGLAAYAGALLLFPLRFVPPPGLLLTALSMAACFALYQVLTRAMSDETPTARLFYSALWVWLSLSLALPWIWTTPTVRDLALMMTIGVLGYVVLLFIDRALDVAPVSKVAPFALAQPLAAVVVDAGLWHQMPTRANLAGVAIVLAAWLAFVWPRNRASAVTSGPRHA